MRDPADEATARRLLEKLRHFASESLDDDERALLGALLAPGVARAYVEAEVEAFGVAGWSPADLPRSLVRALRETGMRVEGLHE